MVDEAYCSECGCTKIYVDPDTGEHTCTACGLVLQKHGVNRGQDKRVFDIATEGHRIRYGEFITPSKVGHVKGSLIRTHCMKGKASPEKQRQFYRLKRAQMRTVNRSSQARNLNQAMNILAIITDKLSVPNYLKEEAALLYRKVLKANMVRGQSIKSMMSACIYAAYRIHGDPVILKKISEAANLPKKDTARCYRLIHKDLRDKNDKHVLDVKLDKAVNHIPHFATQLRLCGEVEKRCREIAALVDEKKLDQGRRPTGMAAAIVYIAAVVEHNIDVTQKEIADIAGVTEVTLRNRYKGLALNLPELGLRPGQSTREGKT